MWDCEAIWGYLPSLVLLSKMGSIPSVMWFILTVQSMQGQKISGLTQHPVLHTVNLVGTRKDA